MTVHSVQEIDATIRRLTGEDPECRPFLCDGSPVGSEVFLVGINPGTDTPFWPHWQVPKGCDKKEWLEDYKRRHLRLKPTRKRIEILMEAISPIKCLETNVFAKCSPDEQSLSEDGRDTAVFDYLLVNIHPKVIFIHGRSGIRHAEQLLKANLPKEQFTPVLYEGHKMEVIVASHLSRGWSYARVRELGERIKEKCAGR